MSGITPLLDTLLHQVLGKRVDLPLSKPLNQPVTPLLPAEAVRALQSDSRLEPSALQARPQAPVPILDGQPAAGGRAAKAPALPPSATTTLSPAARLIADVLSGYSGQPSVLKPAAPLLMPGELPSLDTPKLANQLQQSISSSGLFYEAHLARWQRGELPLPLLQREPQAWLLAARPESATARPGSAEVAASANPAGVGQPAPALVGGLLDRAVQLLARSGAVPLEAGDEGARAPVLPQDPASIRESLHGLIRHQLELLVTPSLRWEGAIWPGTFMSLLLERVDEDDARQEASAQDGEEAGSTPEWQVQFSVRFERLGELSVAARWKGEQLSMALGSDSPALLERFAVDRAQLRERLLDYGFAEVELQAIDSREERPL